MNINRGATIIEGHDGSPTTIAMLGVAPFSGPFGQMNPTDASYQESGMEQQPQDINLVIESIFDSIAQTVPIHRPSGLVHISDIAEIRSMGKQLEARPTAPFHKMRFNQHQLLSLYNLKRMTFQDLERMVNSLTANKAPLPSDKFTWTSLKDFLKSHGARIGMTQTQPFLDYLQYIERSDPLQLYAAGRLQRLTKIGHGQKHS